jgi:hypothetical protein
MVVLDEFKYKDKLNTLVESGVYELLPKDPTAKVERKEQNLLPEHKTALLADLKHNLTPYHSKSPHLYGLSKIHKHGIPLRPIVCSVVSPCYSLAGFLHKILSLLAGKSGSFIKNSGHFVQLLKSVNFQSLGNHVSFDAVSLFSNVPVDEALQVITNKLHNNDTLAERSVLQGEAIMEVLEVCLRTTYFQVMIRSSNRKMAWLWEALCHSLLATSTWRILRNCLLTQHNTNHHCGSGILMTHLWSGLMAQSNYEISSATSIV